MTITLEWQRCPDGYEIADYGAPAIDTAEWLARNAQNAIAMLRGKELPFDQQGMKSGRYVRPVSPRIQAHSLRVDAPAGGRALAFASARGEGALLNFLRDNGLPDGDGVMELPLSEIEAMRDRLKSLLAYRLRNATTAEMVAAFNAIPAGLALGGRPLLSLAMLPADSGPPLLGYAVRSLFDLMQVEVAQVLGAKGALRTCANCGTFFLSGAKSGKREGAIYCSPVCRNAAFRMKHRADERAR